MRGLLKVVFVPNYNVSLAEILMPAADLSEQISTAGMEASGTGNMKFALNGALTIGTLDGANVEIKDCVGDDNIFIFGLTTAEVAERRNNGYDPRAVIEASPELSQALAAISSGVFSPDDPERYRELINGLYGSDWFMVAADFDTYAATRATSTPSGATVPTGTRGRSAMSLASAGSRPIARSANMRKTSGTCPPDMLA
ncbi:hypothetical protein AJ88_08860 [Mesorhizobium amorphae CCBAU 01583]|nr:hypothetical protein AJ88_08860 [Mesorhizobium amorphae CCBAU 01583]